MVRLVADGILVNDSALSCFNSSVVRLVGSPLWITQKMVSGFNSSVVRLVVDIKRTIRPRTNVSIPVWCDW